MEKIYLVEVKFSYGIERHEVSAKSKDEALSKIDILLESKSSASYVYWSIEEKV